MSNDTWECGGMGFKIPDLNKLTYFLETYCEEEVQELVSRYPEKKSISIKLNDVLKFSSGLERALINHYEMMVQILRDALENVSFVRFNTDPIKKDEIEFYICAIPPSYKKSIRELGIKDIGKLVCVDGFAKSVTDAEPKITKAAFECLRCGHITYVEQGGSKFEEPFAGCEGENCGKKGPFKIDIEKSKFSNYQRIHLQESPDSARGTKTYDIHIDCFGELAGNVDPGDRVTITGILKTKQRIGKEGKSTLFEKIIEALSIEKQDIGFEDYVLTPSDEEEILKLSEDPEIQHKICESIAPFIYGYEEAKEGIALLLFSGVRKVLPDGTVIRGTINEGLIGDPSTAKSQLIRWAAGLSPRGIFTSGKTTSTAGLTAAVVKDSLSDGWTLEGGAAVMASGGVLAIDELGQARDEDKSALHEVMEQGTVSISKAGIIATLKAECSVLAAGNPKSGYFDRYEDVSPKQVDIPPALWTRFDLIFIIMDQPNPSFDAAISDHILNNHKIGGMIQNREHSDNSKYSEEMIKQELKEVEAPISKEQLQKYIAYARTHVFPVISEEAKKDIKTFYTDVRKMHIKEGAPVPITVRSLEALQRLSEASARMRLSNTIDQEDVGFATKLIIRSLKDIGLDEDGNLDANVQNGLQSRSQQDKIRWIKGYLKRDLTKEAVIDLMKVEHKVIEDQTTALIKKLLENKEIAFNPDGYLKVIR